MSGWMKIVAIAVLCAIALFVVIKVVIVLAKMVAFLLTVALFLIPVAVGYGIYWLFTRNKNK